MKVKGIKKVFDRYIWISKTKHTDFIPVNSLYNHFFEFSLMKICIVPFRNIDFWDAAFFYKAFKYQKLGKMIEKPIQQVNAKRGIFQGVKKNVID